MIPIPWETGVRRNQWHSVCNSMTDYKMVGRVIVVLCLICLQLGISFIMFFMKVIYMEIRFIFNSPYQIKWRLPPSSYMRFIIPQLNKFLQCFTADINLIFPIIKNINNFREQFILFPGIPNKNMCVNQITHRLA